MNMAPKPFLFLCPGIDAGRYSSGLGRSIMFRSSICAAGNGIMERSRSCCWPRHSRFWARNFHLSIDLWLFIVLLTPFIARHPTGELAHIVGNYAYMSPALSMSVVSAIIVCKLQFCRGLIILQLHLQL